MFTGDLTDLQRQVLKILAKLDVSWRLSGGGAIIGAYLHHRMTRDLDIFFVETFLGEIPKITISLLKQFGLSVSIVQNDPAFCRIKIEREKEILILDLVAENTRPVEPPRTWDCEGVPIQIDSLQELIVTKLCALLGRSEIRDLIDLQELLGLGGNLNKALEGAAKKDLGFSPLVLAWVLRELPIEAFGKALKLGDQEILKLLTFRDELIEKLTEASVP